MSSPAIVVSEEGKAPLSPWSCVAATVCTALFLTAGCETSSTIEAPGSPPGGIIALRLQPCVDRTHTQGRDLGSEATAAFIEALKQSQAFRLDSGAQYTLICEVDLFIEGSALKRWLLPGCGSTVGQVAAMITDSRTGRTVLIARGNANVNSGGLYTIGADTYILSTAVNDAVRQMANWARGQPTGSATQAEIRTERAVL